MGNMHCDMPKNGAAISARNPTRDINDAQAQAEQASDVWCYLPNK